MCTAYTFCFFFVIILCELLVRWVIWSHVGSWRRSGLILCSIITLAGALISTFAWSEDALIVARIITGVGMGGEYPLASSHSAESCENSGGMMK